MKIKIVISLIGLLISLPGMAVTLNDVGENAANFWLLNNKDRSDPLFQYFTSSSPYNKNSDAYHAMAKAAKEGDILAKVMLNKKEDGDLVTNSFQEANWILSKYPYMVLRTDIKGLSKKIKDKNNRRTMMFKLAIQHNPFLIFSQFYPFVETYKNPFYLAIAKKAIVKYSQEEQG